MGMGMGMGMSLCSVMSCNVKASFANLLVAAFQVEPLRFRFVRSSIDWSVVLSEGAEEAGQAGIIGPLLKIWFGLGT